MSLADYQALLPRLVRENGGKITPQDFDRAIASAVLQYSADAPRQLVVDVEWPDAGYVMDPAPPGVTVDSTVLRAEHPIGQVPAQLVEVALQVTGDTLQLVCTQQLAQGAAVRLTYTAPHELSNDLDEADTIPLRHRDAVAAYAAHLLCRELATLYAGEREASIGADGSNTESRARNYAARARDYRAAYYAGIGATDPMAAASGGSGSAASGGVVQGAGAVTSWGRRDRAWLRTQSV